MLEFGAVSSLTFDGFLFYVFWGSVLMIVVCGVLWLFERND